MLTHPIEQCKQLKFNYCNEVLDISHLDVSYKHPIKNYKLIINCIKIWFKIAATKIMEFGEQPSPVLIVTFTAQQIIYVTDSKGTVQEGDKVTRDLIVLFVWFFFKIRFLDGNL